MQCSFYACWKNNNLFSQQKRRRKTKRGSNQCGLFAAMYLLARYKGLKIPQHNNKINLEDLVSATTPHEFERKCLRHLQEKSPAAGAAMSQEDIRMVLEHATIGTQIQHDHIFQCEPHKKRSRYGTVVGLPVTTRSAGRRWCIEFEPTKDDEDDDYEVSSTTRTNTKRPKIRETMPASTTGMATVNHQTW